LRFAYIGAALFALANVSSALGQNGPDLNTMPLDQLARAIAHTIDVSTQRSPGAAIAFDGATVQGMKVVIHFTVNDQAAFSKTKAAVGHARETVVAMFCRDPQKSIPIKRGISLEYVIELADKSDRYAYAVDAAACASLATVKPASSEGLGRMAGDLLKELGSAEETAHQKNSGLVLKSLEAKSGVVEQRLAVVAPAFESFYRANIPQTKGVLQGYVCSKFGDKIRRGLRFRQIYERDDGTQLSELNFGPSDC
jgi:hypothetical protein